MSGDWQCDKSLAECNQYMLEHEINTDVTFIIDNKDKDDNAGSVSVKAHKYMLVSRSPVFYAMLCGTLAEQGDIRVEDAKPEAFKEMLKYIYTDEIEISPTNVFDIIYLSNKYIIPLLTKECIQYLHSILTADNACLILDQSLIYEDKTLIAKCYKLIQLYTYTALKSETILDIRKETLMKILDCNLLMKETDVFNACVRWAKHQLELKQVEATGENIRNVLGDCIHKIGYANMGNEDFASVVIPVGVLWMEEEVAMFRYMGNKELHPPPPNFLCTNRNGNVPQKMFFSHLIEKETISDGNVKVTVICEMTDIEVKSLFIGCCSGNTNIKYVHLDDNALCVTEKNAMDYRMQEWKLDSAIVLRKGQNHTLKFTFFNAKDDEEEPVFVIKRSSVIFRGDILKLTLQSNTSFIPLLGFSCFLQILK